jgi:hypothetical protein
MGSGPGFLAGQGAFRQIDMIPSALPTVPSKMKAMRRTLHGFSLALVLASSAVLGVGCGGLTDFSGLERLFPSGTFGGGPSSPLVGQWTLTSINVNNVSVNCPGTLTSGGTSYSCEATVRNIIANGTFNDTAPPDQVGSGTWTVTSQPNSTLLAFTKNNVITSGTASLSADLSQFLLTVGTENMIWTKG